ncbi:MAG: hypothetical protein A2156_12035 [Deltaproteobacteria bacterium RBG_16_48_10]|nr:MAG: hypothetical protein A2156_12035 [Deltaproteobacteria bacterium RBG_16_48_10]
MKKSQFILFMVVIALIIAFWVIGRDFAWFRGTGDPKEIRQEIDRIDKLLTRLKTIDRTGERSPANVPIVTFRNPASPTSIHPARKSIESISPGSSQVADTEWRNPVTELPETEILPQSQFVEKPPSEPIVTEDYIIDGDNITFRDPSRGTYKTSDEARRIRESMDVSQIP